MGGPSRPLRVLHLILMLGPTNGQYNEHVLPMLGKRDIGIATYFPPKLTPPAGIPLFAGDGSPRGALRALRKALRTRPWDVIHAHSQHTGVLLVLGLLTTRPRLRRRTVYTVLDSYHDYRLRNRLLLIPMLAFFQEVVFCSRATLDSMPWFLKRLRPKHHHIVQNTVDVARIEKAVEAAPPRDDPSRFDVVSVGRLEKVKDPYVVVDAFKHGAGGHASLAFIGEGSLRGSLTEHIEASGVDDRITLTGLIDRDAVFTRCAQADVFVSASHGEGLPVAVLEAMAARCPVVLSDIPPHREISERIDFIPLVPIGDVQGFAREIDSVRAMSPEERAEIGEQCNALVKARFTLEHMHASLDVVYGLLLDGGTPA